jgi:RimJ/RimL family protein N-acetyltransferase
MLAAGENYRLVPFDVSFTEALFEAAATASASALAPFGLNALRLIRLEIVVAETNFASRSVAEKIGAGLEIRLPYRLILGGEILHAYLYSLLGPRPER